MLPNKEGQHVPDVTFKTRKGEEWADISTADLFNGKTVVVFSLPGAYTPTCSSTHLPRYNELIPTTGEAMACRALGSTWGELRRQRLRNERAAITGPPTPRQPRPSPLGLSEAERQLMPYTLGGERFADTAPARVHATLLDEGCYLGSVPTMYAFSRPMLPAGNADTRGAILPPPSPNCWPPTRTRFGRAAICMMASLLSLPSIKRSSKANELTHSIHQQRATFNV